MAATFIRSDAERPRDFVDSREVRETEPNESWGADYHFEPTFADEEMHDGIVCADDVEGLPLNLVKLYAEIAARHAWTRKIDPGVWVSTVAGLDGAWGDGATRRKAEDSLQEAIVGWVAVKRRVGASDIPPMEGIDLNRRP